MIQRPSVKDSEEDLLRQQAEFLKEKGIPTQNSPETLKPLTISNSDHRISLIGAIIERKTDGVQENFIDFEPGKRSFPDVFLVNTGIKKGPTAKKKSLFALKLEEKIRKEQAIDTDITEEIPHSGPQTIEVLNVHKENEAKIGSMTREEILAEKQSLEGMLSPEMLSFLKTRGAKRKAPEQNVEQPEHSEAKSVDVDEVKKNLMKTVDAQWIEMDRIEPEKLEWIGDIPDATSLDPDKPYSARFDFTGDLLPFQLDVDVRTSLHHHGDEPERPGYTIQELYQLSRSTVLQQRILALNTLANIIRKTKMGYYDQCFNGCLLKKLVESDVFFLLRFSMDDRPVTPAAVNCLSEFFTCRSDEVCLDRLLNFTEEDEEPILFVPFEVDNDTEEAELKDRLIIDQDIVKGVLRTDILVRFNYILREFRPDQVTVAKIFETIIRICRHSEESCNKVLNTPGLIPAVFENVYSPEPFPQAVKLIRVLVSVSPKSARIIMSQSLSFILKYLDMDAPAFKLKLECLSLWKSLIRSDLMISEFTEFTPCLTRLLFFYVEKVDTVHGQFDFELFSGIVSLINIVLSKKIPIDSHYELLLRQCLQKWFAQLYDTACNYSVAKAIGTALRFFIFKYSIYGVENRDVSFLKTIGASLASWLKCDQFLKITQDLNYFSHIQTFAHIDRDPGNLPSLMAVNLNGSGYVAFLQIYSPFPLIISLTNFLLKLVDISHESKPLLEMITAGTHGYYQKTLKCTENYSWFSRYEMKLLTALTECNAKLKHPNSLYFSFQCLPFFRTDDKAVIKILKAIFSSNIWHKDLSNLYTEYFKAELKNCFYHDSKNISRDWIYRPIAKDPVNVLKCLTTILQTSPNLLDNVPHTIRYYRLCCVFLDEDNIFNSEIQACMEVCFSDIVANFHKLDLTIKVSENRSFYEFFMELVTQYAGTSYGNVLFAKFVTLPLAQNFDVSFRKLLWSEYMHVIRVISLPENVNSFIPLDVFVTPVETDESLLVTYVNAVAKNVITIQRNGFIFSVAVENIKRYQALPKKDERLFRFITYQINNIRDEALKKKLQMVV